MEDMQAPPQLNNRLCEALISITVIIKVGEYLQHIEDFIPANLVTSITKYKYKRT